MTTITKHWHTVFCNGEGFWMAMAKEGPFIKAFIPFEEDMWCEIGNTKEEATKRLEQSIRRETGQQVSLWRDWPDADTRPPKPHTGDTPQGTQQGQED